MAVLSAPAGTDVHEPFTFLDEDGVAVSLVGVTGLTCILWQGAYTAIFTLTVGVGVTVLDAANGKARMDLTHVQTQSMAGRYSYEWYATLVSGDRVLLDRGDFYIVPSFVGV